MPVKGMTLDELAEWRAQQARSRAGIKFTAGDELEILAIPYGEDLDGEHFSERTDLGTWFEGGSMPLLFCHGKDEGTGIAPVGRVDMGSVRRDRFGVWVRAQLDRAHAYYQHVKRLIEQGALGASSGAMGHLVQKAPDGEILVWPWTGYEFTMHKAINGRVSALPDPSAVWVRSGLGKDELRRTVRHEARHLWQWCEYGTGEGRLDHDAAEADATAYETP